LYREISGQILQVLGVNVVDATGDTVPAGTPVYVNGSLAGVTGGASLIKSSELRSVMGEARGYSVAVNAFFTQFDALPGDYKVAISAGDVPGDGDDLIEHYSDATTAVAEGLEAWRDLSAVGALSETLTYLTAAQLAVASTADAVPGTNIPSSKIKGAGWAFDSTETSNLNVVVLTGTTSENAASATNSLPVPGVNADGTATSVYTGALTPTDALSIDAKSDDADPETGNVRAVGPNEYIASSGHAIASTACYVNGDETEGAATTQSATEDAAEAAKNSYNVASTEKSCGLAFSVDVNS